jgi:hypothetical protein
VASGRLRREIEDVGLGGVVARAIAYPIVFVLKWPVRALGIVLRRINEPVRRFSVSHDIAKRVGAFFARHTVLAGIVGLSFVLVWFLPVVALTVRHWSAFFPGWTAGDLAWDFRSAWALVGLSAGALVMGGLGNGPIASAVTEPQEVVDLGFVAFVIGLALAPPIVLALWAYGLL